MERISIQTMSVEMTGAPDPAAVRSETGPVSAVVASKSEGMPVPPAVPVPGPDAAVDVREQVGSATSDGQYTESQRAFQRLLLRNKRGESLPGDGMKRFGINASIFTGATLVDLAESHLVDAVIREPMDAAIERITAKGKSFENAAKTAQGNKLALEFIEEWGSDSAYAALANAWLRMMTGVNGAHYVTETSAFIADWGNVISQVFFADRLYGKTITNGKHVHPKKIGGIKLAYTSADFFNPVNVEAAFRMAEELPVVGGGIAWLHEKTDHALESTIGRLGNTTAAKGILGFHIGKNIKPL